MKLAFSNSVFLFLVSQILLLVVLMCMSLSLASFLSLTGPGELWRNARNTVMKEYLSALSTFSKVGNMRNV